jgi:uncharacterized protein (TIGR02001 family)
MKKNIGILALLLLCSAAPAMALGPVDISLDFVSKYLWRGFDLNLAKPAIQPGVTYAVGESGLSVNLWGSISFEDKSLTELDLTVDFSKEIGPIALSVGLIHYGWYFNDPFKFADHTTQEVYASITLGVPLSPSLTLAYDINVGSGLYAEAGISHSLGLGPVSLDLSAAVGLNVDYWIDKIGVSHLALGAALPVGLGSITITPSANLTIPLLDEVNPESAVFWFGLGLAF